LGSINARQNSSDIPPTLRGHAVARKSAGDLQLGLRKGKRVVLERLVERHLVTQVRRLREGDGWLASAGVSSITSFIAPGPRADDRRAIEDGRRRGLVELDGYLRREPLCRIRPPLLPP